MLISSIVTTWLKTLSARRFNSSRSRGSISWKLYAPRTHTFFRWINKKRLNKNDVRRHLLNSTCEHDLSRVKLISYVTRRIISSLDNALSLEPRWGALCNAVRKVLVAKQWAHSQILLFKSSKESGLRTAHKNLHMAMLTESFDSSYPCK